MNFKKGLFFLWKQSVVFDWMLNILLSIFKPFLFKCCLEAAFKVMKGVADMLSKINFQLNDLSWGLIAHHHNRLYLIGSFVKIIHLIRCNAVCRYYSPWARLSACSSSLLFSPLNRSGFCTAGSPSSFHSFQTHSCSSELSCSADLASCCSAIISSNKCGFLPRARLSARLHLTPAHSHFCLSPALSPCDTAPLPLSSFLATFLANFLFHLRI